MPGTILRRADQGSKVSLVCTLIAVVNTAYRLMGLVQHVIACGIIQECEEFSLLIGIIEVVECVVWSKAIVTA